MKSMIWIGATVGGIAGGALGALFDHGNIMGGWSLLLSTIGGVAGIVLGYKIGSNM